MPIIRASDKEGTVCTNAMLGLRKLVRQLRALDAKKDTLLYADTYLATLQNNLEQCLNPIAIMAGASDTMREYASKAHIAAFLTSRQDMTGPECIFLQMTYNNATCTSWPEQRNFA